MRILIYIAVGIASALAAWILITFNRFVRYRNLLREAWSGIDVQLKRRHDLVPPLIECVKGYRAYERSLFQELTLSRSKVAAAQGIMETSEAENGLVRGMRQLLAVAEAYPVLKANQTFQQLSTSLVEIEDQLQFARRYYNGTVRDYNIMVESFPSRVVARMFGFATTCFFEIEPCIERKAPEVQL